MAARVRAEERLTNLVVALMASDIGLTKKQILDNISGYRQRQDAGTKQDALEKMFERDKEELRALGIPIETIGEASDPNDLREARYRIPQDEYVLPADVTFSPAELAILQLAGSVWSQSSASSDALAGVRKIRALGIDGDAPIIGFAPRVAVREASFPELQTAIEQSRIVQFDYLKPGETQARRRVIAPLTLLDYEGRWHIYGIDQDAGAPRTFLLRRIVSDVTQTPEGFDPNLRAGAGERALAGLTELAQRQRALLEVTPGTEAALRLGRRAEPAPQGIIVPYVDLHIFADEVASFGPEARVVEPAELRDAVVARLRAVVERHSCEQERA